MGAERKDEIEADQLIGAKETGTEFEIYNRVYILLYIYSTCIMVPVIIRVNGG